MTRTSIGLSLVAAFAVAASLGAQTTTTSQSRSSMDHEKNISVTGCLQRDATGGYILSNAHIDTNPSSASGSTTTTTTGTTTGTTGTTGTTTTAGTTTAPGAEASATMSPTWKLEGASSDLDRHVGHKVTVTGHETSPSSSSSAGTTTTAGTTATTGTTGTTSITSEEQKRSSSSSQPDRRLDVQSVKMVSSTCP